MPSEGWTMFSDEELPVNHDDLPDSPDIPTITKCNYFVDNANKVFIAKHFRYPVFIGNDVILDM